MRYHAHALAANGVDVDLVGLEGTPLPMRITDDPRITVHRIKGTRLRIRRTLYGSSYAVAGLFHATRLGLRLWKTLRRVPRPDLVLIQNPPAFPTFAVTWWSLRRPGVRFFIDWHNLGYTLLRLRLGHWHPTIRLARWLEQRDARRVEGNLCVSRGLAAFLESRFGVTNARVLYDRPASAFVPIERGDRERHRQALFTRLGVHAETVGFVVCPTSWTEDEDFDVIIDAVVRLEHRVRGWESPACRRAGFNCGRGGSNRTITRALSAAPTSASACTGRRLASISR
jgi:beta-1,4-mannosyltransferase